MGRMKYFLSGLLLSVAALVLTGAKIEDDNIKLCIPLTANSCYITFDTNDGAGNISLQADSGQLKINNGPLTESQITNSEIDLGTASDTSRLVVGKGDSATLSGLTRKEGVVMFDTDQDNLVVDNGVDLLPVGSGGGSSGINVLENPDFEINANSWTATGGTVTQETSSPVGNGKGSLRWTPTNTAQVLTPDAVEIPDVLGGKACLTSFSYRYVAGADNDIKVKIVDGGDNLTDYVDLVLTPGTSEWRPVQLAYICPTGSSPQPAFETTVASPQPLFLDDVHTGSDYRVGLSSFNGIWKIYTESDVTFTNTPAGWTGPEAALMPYKTNDDTWRLRVNVEATTDSLTAQDFDIVGITTSSRLAYQACSSSGNGSTGYAQVDPSSTFVVRNVSGTTTVRVYCDFELDSKPTWVDFDPPAQETVTLETQGWHIDANIGGSNVGLTTGVVTSYIALANSAIDLVANSGSAPVGISCNSTEENSVGNTTCVGSETVGIVFNAPYAGLYESCFDISMQMSGAASSVQAITWQLFQRANANATTLLQAGKTRAYNGMNPGSTVGTGATQTQSIRVCGLFNLSVGKTTVGLYYEQNDDASSSSTVVADRNASLGDRDIHVTVIPLTQNFPQAVAIANVETGAGNSGCLKGNICSITYTPTCTNRTNVTSCSATGPFNVIRVGNVASVSGSLTVTTGGSSGTRSSAGISLPIPSALDDTDCGGISSINTSSTTFSSGWVRGDSTNDDCTWDIPSSGAATAKQTVVNFQYLIK